MAHMAREAATGMAEVDGGEASEGGGQDAYVPQAILSVVGEFAFGGRVRRREWTGGRIDALDSPSVLITPVFWEATQG